MPLLLKGSRSILFMHIPKCGGSSIVELFKGNGFSSQLEIRGLAPLKCLTASPQHQTPAILKTFIRQKYLEDIFIVVRNPYQRIRSEFNWIHRYKNTYERPDFNEWILSSLRKASRDANYADNHFRPSIDFIDGEMPCKIFRIEDGISHIKEYYLHDINSSDSKEDPYAKGADKYYRNKNSKVNFTEESINAINSFYKHDFKAFDYETISTEKGADEVNLSSKKRDDKQKQIQLAISWRQKTLTSLSKKIEDQIILLDKRLQSKEGKIREYIKNHNSDVKKECKLYIELRKISLLRLNYLSKNLVNPNYNTEIEKCKQLNMQLKLINAYRRRLNIDPII